MTTESVSSREAKLHFWTVVSQRGLVPLLGKRFSWVRLRLTRSVQAALPVGEANVVLAKQRPSKLQPVL